MPKEKDYAVFTEEMKKTHAILAPDMLPIHFKILAGLLNQEGYQLIFCKGERSKIIEEGLKNTHNDICYPAMLVVGQMFEALKSGDYDSKKIAMIMSQTGGGCRASNYIYLIRKALKNQGLDDIPVISANLSGLEEHPGFKLSSSMFYKMIKAAFYGDLLMMLGHQCRPYEKIKGVTDGKIEDWIQRLIRSAKSPKFLASKKIYKRILEDFSTIPREKSQKAKVGIVGEIYMKYSPLGNNYLEAFLEEEETQVVMSGVTDFLMYCLINPTVDHQLYGMSLRSSILSYIGYNAIYKEQTKLIECFRDQNIFKPPTDFKKVKKLAQDFIGLGIKMGEGWLLTAEMLELLESGVDNIVCTQPFGCLPNHIVGKGMIRKIKQYYPSANITAIDYDPSESKVNQHSRIKLMLANAKIS